MYFNDTISTVIQALNRKGNRNLIVEADEKMSSSQQAGILPLKYQYSKETPSKTITYLSELSPELLNKKWHLSDTILLGDVNVIAYRRKKDDGHFRPYLEADYVIDVTEDGKKLYVLLRYC